MDNNNTDKEIWKGIKGYEGCYQISNKGRVKSIGRVVSSLKCKRKTVPTRILCQNINKVNGYASVQLSSKGMKKRVTIHRLVAFAFIEYTEGKEVNHINGNKLDNRLENLEFVTKSENINHAHKTGLINMKDRGNKPVLQYDLNGVFIQNFPSVLKATIHMGKTNGTSISKACKKIQKTAYGYKWEYAYSDGLIEEE